MQAARTISKLFFMGGLLASKHMGILSRFLDDFVPLALGILVLLFHGVIRIAYQLLLLIHSDSIRAVERLDAEYKHRASIADTLSDR